ncbi:GTP pyrophosphokinase YjbM [Janthinobacterium sp. MP5059B]|uniref:GTP pyrophosphokinase n=1 Tax=Janthinobacterium sp. MP5059B TaxID=1766683 RepID=UPI0008939C5F|nr:hypothetical protein [Janthinobacterium sp. MP5059B]OEZ48027.1 GTP pyrophosphokinase YjbM [Janthinobacterium sp. MP5059B]
MSKISNSTAPVWHRENLSLFQGFSEILNASISNLLKSQKISHLSVTVRVKNLDSLIEKIERKGYSKEEEITDMVGVRIITYLEADVKKVCDLLESTFEFHEEKSGNKAENLQIDQIGYRSVHYVCELGKDRTALPELNQYKKIMFEIQVRTVLQHAWAEIEHDRNYKFSGELPSAIKRRLNLLAGTLELVDREFDVLAKEVDLHEKQAKVVAHSGNLKGVELTSAGLTELIMANEEITKLINFPGEQELWPEIIFKELRSYGVNTLEEFDKLINPSFLQAYKEAMGHKWINGMGFVRYAMIYDDMDTFLDKVDRTWGVLGESSFVLLEKKYGKEKVDATLKSRNILVMPD